MSEPRSFRFARHFRWSMLGQASTAIASFLATPFLIGHLGLEVYGLYVILQSATNYLTLAALGAGGATVSHVAAARADGDHARLLKVLRYSFLMHGPTVLVAGVVAATAARPLLSGLFQVPEHLLGSGVRVLAGAAVGAVFFSLTQAAVNALQGLQRFEASNTVTFVQSGLLPLVCVVLVRAGGGVESMALAYAVIQAAGAAWAWAWLWRVVSHDAKHDARHKEHLSLAGFASWSFSQWLGQLAWIVSFQLDRVFAAQHVSLAAMTLYAVPVGLLQRLNMIPATFNSVALPMLTELRAPAARSELQRLYLRQFRLLLWLGLPGLVLLFSFMPQFLSLWLGGQFGDASVWPARLQVIAQAFALFTALPGAAALALGAPWALPGLAWSQALLSVGAWSVLVPRWGLVGVGWGALLAQAVPTVFYLVLVHRRVLHLDVRRFVEQSVLAPAACAGAMLAVVFPFHASVSGWASLAAMSAGGLGVYALAAWVLLGSDDRALVRRYVDRQRP